MWITRTPAGYIQGLLPRSTPGRNPRGKCPKKTLDRTALCSPGPVSSWSHSSPGRLEDLRGLWPAWHRTGNPGTWIVKTPPLGKVIHPRHFIHMGEPLTSSRALLKYLVKRPPTQKHCCHHYCYLFIALQWAAEVLSWWYLVYLVYWRGSFLRL